jgi:hypothetical protein
MFTKWQPVRPPNGHQNRATKLKLGIVDMLEADITAPKVANVLGISADLPRWRLKAGKYLDPPRGTAGRRLFSIEDVAALSTAVAGGGRQRDR